MQRRGGEVALSFNFTVETNLKVKGKRGSVSPLPGLWFSKFSPSLSLFTWVCECVCVCAEACGSHVFPYMEWLWEEWERNEQNYSAVTPPSSSSSSSAAASFPPTLHLKIYLYTTLSVRLSVCDVFMLNECDSCSVSSLPSLFIPHYWPWCCITKWLIRVSISLTFSLPFWLFLIL